MKTVVIKKLNAIIELNKCKIIIIPSDVGSESDPMIIIWLSLLISAKLAFESIYFIVVLLIISIANILVVLITIIND